MTIYKPKPNDRKVEKKDSSRTKVVIPEDVEPLAVKVTTGETPVRILVLPAAQRQRRYGVVVACLILLLVVLIFALAVSGFLLYRHLMLKTLSQKLHVETTEVRYYEYQRADSNNVGRRRRVDGFFNEDIEMDCEHGAYERLNVPPILESRKSTVVHDFEKNLTAIVDRDNERCFVMPLDRSTVKPPKSFLDLLIKYKSGYYLPDAEIVRDKYKVQLPAVDDLEPFGFYIWYDCRWYQTYRLVHDDNLPRLVSKREACEMEGLSYCLGETGGDKMLCFKVSGCA